MKNKIETVGLIVLFIGIALLIFTFLNAYWFLTQQTSITAGANLTAVFGEALAPLIVTCIRIMYLGIMGWIGSMLTLKGITLLTQPKPSTMAVSKKIQAKPKVVPQKTQIKQVQPQPAESTKTLEVKAQKPPQVQAAPHELTPKPSTPEAEKEEEKKTEEVIVLPEQVQETPQQTE